MNIRAIIRSIDDFWFKESSTVPLALFRILFGSFILTILVISYPNWMRFYGPDSLIPLDIAKEKSLIIGWSLFVLADSSLWLWSIYIASIILTILFILGYLTRSVTISLFIIFLSMRNRAPALINGQDQVILLFLFLSCFAALRASYSIDNYRAKAKNLKLKELQPIWPLRLMQISFALIYAYCGPAKLFASTEWQEGSAIYYISLSDRWFRYPEFELFHNLFLSKILTYGSLVIEILFPYLVWIPALRFYSVITLFIFHLSIALTLAPSVFYFNIAMLTVLTVFLGPKYCQKIFYKFSVLRQKSTD